MPSARTYKSGSVIYFAGDRAERVFVLKSGRVSLRSTDIETGVENRDFIRTGEFFGVKSALGGYPREEDAMVESDAAVVIFSVREFEALASQNTRIILQMLKVFSNQLRRIQGKVRNVMAVEEQKNPERGLYEIGEFYLQKRRYRQACYALGRYIELYPQGQWVADARRKLREAEDYAQRYGDGKGPQQPADRQPTRPKLSGVAERFYQGETLAAQGDYAQAIRVFTEVATSGDADYVAPAQYAIGQSLYQMKQYEKGIQQLQAFIKGHTHAEQVPDALYLIGAAYAALGDNDRAETFLKQILRTEGVSDETRRKATKQLRQIKAA